MGEKTEVRKIAKFQKRKKWNWKIKSLMENQGDKIPIIQKCFQKLYFWGRKLQKLNIHIYITPKKEEY